MKIQVLLILLALFVGIFSAGISPEETAEVQDNAPVPT